MDKINSETLDRAQRRTETERLLSNIKSLPLIPKMMFEVTKFLQSPAPTTSGLARLVGRDQGLTAKILSVANSPLYGLQRKVTSLEFAIIVLGYKEISDIVSALSLAESIKSTSDKYFNHDEFWLHSMVVGSAAKGIAQNLGHMDLGSDAFVAGMLHELGIQLMHKYMHRQFEDICRKVWQQEESFSGAELDTLGMTHQELGKFLAERWNLPVVLCDTLSHHHSPGELNPRSVLAAVVHLADYMTQKLKIANVYWDENMQLDPSIVDTLQLSSQENLEKFILEYKDLFIETVFTIRM
ncbi:MAG: HDOD domain-containing protein [Ignavibacteria bacterium]|jgi:HD-like signal output (HDOD) protein|nr:HDOD domain-containing protein [Ignavibacteria bacterium]MCU7504804.1 HDOD domain-containing protein [Ignavibacteria bacterium]MCU7517690.1 HDOD domain-containing protein [Ignavibacteria bacterium]